MKKFDDIAVGIPTILLPRKDIDLSKWSVVACDQYTSQPEYWEKVKAIVGDSPSTLNLIFPEVYLGKEGDDKRIEQIKENMKKYLNDNIFVKHDGMIYVERKFKNGKMRRGLLLCLDLDKYDFNKGSKTLIRATEGTVLDRIPPRVKIREGALIELPHILMLIDDPDKKVIEPLSKKHGKKLYDFELMMNGGHLTGYSVVNEEEIINGLKGLVDPLKFKRKYDLENEDAVLLFAAGDGNHSLATAKTVWENIKKNAKGDLSDHPARYALVEVVNIHDDDMEFEPIHRVVFELKEDIITRMKSYFKNNLKIIDCSSKESMISEVQKSTEKIQRIGMIFKGKYSILEITKPSSNLPVGTLQAFLDEFMKEKGAKGIDYIHGADATCELGSKTGNVGFYLPAMKKSELFKTVIVDGVLPRKTFSIGEAEEKRYYMEARKIVP